VSAEKILNQDEIDALIHGVDSGAVNTEPEPVDGEVRGYDGSCAGACPRSR